MIITCQECDSRFVLDDKLIKPTGSKVRCSSCKHVFKVFTETAAPSPVEPPTLSPEPAPVAPPPKAQPLRNLDEGDELADELDRELDRLFGPDDDAFFEGSPEKEAAPSVPPPLPEPRAEAAPLDSIDEIDLDDLGLDDLGLSESPSALTSDDFDLSDLDLDLSLDDERGPAPASGGEEVEEALDFSDFEASLSGEDLDESGFEDLDFSDLEAALEAPDAEVVAGAAELEEEFDFSELALSLDDDSGEMGLGEGADELDLSLDDELFGAASASAGSAAASGAGLPAEDHGFTDLDLDLELDLDESDPMQMALENSLDEELDLSELENLLQEEPSAQESLLVDDDIELELDFDFQTDEKTEEMEPLAKEGMEDSDFSDIEAMLENDDTPLDAAADLDEELDLNLELDLAPGVGSAADVSLGVNAEPAMELAEIDDDDRASAPRVSTREKASKTFDASGGKGSGLRIFLTMLLVVVLLFAILVGVYAMRDKIRDRTGIAIPTIALVEQAREQVAALGIPVVSDWVRPEVKDLFGNLNMVTQDVAGRFVTSPTLGDLFVITGKVRNNYQATRHSIRLMGRLFSKDNREVQGKEFFAGNMMTDEELATLSMEQIDQKLATTLGNENINARVRPGQLVPFMVVYSMLPDDLAEFAVEVRESKEGSALK
jgi:predicted Zn finger-like uncharacterized protein